MAIALVPLDAQGADRDALVAFLSGNRFPYHVVPRPTADEARAAIDGGAYSGEEHAAFWLDHSEAGRVGVARLDDLQDPTPLVDLRIGEGFRGRGLGEAALRALTAHVFSSMPHVDRLEGQTREDNVAMRVTFLRCGWVKEAHYREAWPVADGRPVASVAYAVLRRDWAEGTTTPVPWDDDPHVGQGESAGR
jgi:RimJ/RimL family protein N-acetyltransferase